MPHPRLPDTYNLTSEGFRKLKCFAGFLAAFLESYMVVMRYFTDTEEPPEDGTVRLRQIQHMGMKLFKHQEVVRKEALSKINYLNAVDYALKCGYHKGGKDGDTPADTFGMIRTYMKYLPL